MCVLNFYTVFNLHISHSKKNGVRYDVYCLIVLSVFCYECLQLTAALLQYNFKPLSLDAGLMATGQ